MANLDIKSNHEMRLYGQSGDRLYLTQDERQRFLEASQGMDRKVRTLCMTICLTGCRISEVLNLRVSNIDLDDQLIIFESLKKRKAGVFRAVPVPPHLMESLDLVHGIREAMKGAKKENAMLWEICRKTAYTRIIKVMERAGIEGHHASPKGLRHGFGVHAINSGVPLNMLQKWLGHASLKTTSIYANAQGKEARNLASRMW